MEYFQLKLIHIISSTIFFGTGIGSAFYMFTANRQKDVRVIYFTVKNVVIADFIFTAPAVIVQLISGVFLSLEQGYFLEDKWLLFGVLLYFFAVICWLPVVWIQIKMRDMAKNSVEKNKPLPKLYWKMESIWIALGFLALPAIIATFYLMVFKPSF